MNFPPEWGRLALFAGVLMGAALAVAAPKIKKPLAVALGGLVGLLVLTALLAPRAIALGISPSVVLFVTAGGIGIWLLGVAVVAALGNQKK